MILYTRPTIVAGDVQLYYENMGGDYLMMINHAS